MRQSRAIMEQMTAAIEEARAPVDPAALVRRENVAATGAGRRVGALAQAHSWRTVLIGTAALTGFMAATGAGGYWLGRESQIVTASQVEAAALRDGPDAAASWLGLMEANDGWAVRAACVASSTVTDGNRSACVIGVWIEPPANSGPRTVPAGK